MTFYLLLIIIANFFGSKIGKIFYISLTWDEDIEEYHEFARTSEEDSIEHGFQDRTGGFRYKILQETLLGKVKPQEVHRHEGPSPWLPR